MTSFLLGLVIGSFATAHSVVSSCSSTVAFTTGLILVFLSSLDWLKIQRQLEGYIGGFLIQIGTNNLLKNAGLVSKKITLTSESRKGLTVHYYERLPPNGSSQGGPTLLLCHGMTSDPKNLAALVVELIKELPEWRMILPSAIGHGDDLERVRELGSKFEHPTPVEMKEPIRDLLLELGITKCCAYGASMGGALVYFLQDKYPELVEKSILISPAVEAVLQDKFIEDWDRGLKNHFCWESRDDVKHFMEDLACPKEQQQVSSPIPSFMLQAIWEERQRRAPPRHFRNYFQHLLNVRGTDPEWLGCPQDCSPNLPRLVFWPKEDYICNHDKGKAFFSKSTKTEFRSIPGCGHLFHSDGKTVLMHTAPMMAQYLLNDHDK